MLRTKEQFIEDAKRITGRLLERELPQGEFRDEEFIKLAAPLIADFWMHLRYAQPT